MDQFQIGLHHSLPSISAPALQLRAAFSSSCIRRRDKHEPVLTPFPHHGARIADTFFTLRRRKLTSPKSGAVRHVAKTKACRVNSPCRPLNLWGFIPNFMPFLDQAVKGFAAVQQSLLILFHKELTGAVSVPVTAIIAA
ncbi:hypothetical protein [Agrobacterium larrymoorei]|uniref:Uncharacterized protein n=1 Tax=Agrobacterium larrymoorei TaxID=160699 RepID=A0A4D7E5B6_9HYPH|nr:hypothetical protein [Agrobacterium larrymoorei]QCJ00371.1 hypothetical protein CFBP5473_20845 [Agrobacterium larrymoorei]QYA09184.1 hypothetical protein J5285_17510 [Agrobacterium larrymoorei]